MKTEQCRLATRSSRKPKPARKPMYCCLECGRKFYTTSAASRAANNGCPGCNGVDIDLYVA